MASGLMFVCDDEGHPVDLVKVRTCDSKHHRSLVLAVRLVHWVTGPVEYCEPCADWMSRVAEALGVHIVSEIIPPPAGRTASRTRAINLKGGAP